MTKVINFLAGPGSGKSTSAADIFVEMKHRNLKCELVREYVKNWAYIGLKPEDVFDQLYITGKQLRAESIYYNKLDYIITDSPVIFGVVYDYVYNNSYEIKNIILKYLDLAKQKNVEHIYYFIKRNKPYVKLGRYQDEKEAKEIDIKMMEVLKECNISYKLIDTTPRKVVKEILKDLKIK